MIYNYQQNNVKWKNIKYSSKNHPFATVGTSGCGIFAVINALSNMFNLNLESDIPDFIKWAKESGARELEGTDINTFLKYLKKEIIIPFDYFNSSKNSIDETLRSFGVVIFLTGYDKTHLFSDNGHFCTIVGMKNDKYIVSDSYNYTGKINLYNRSKYLTPFENNTFLVEKSVLINSISGLWCIFPKFEENKKSFKFVKSAINNGAYSTPAKSELIGSFNKNQKVILTKTYNMWRYKSCEVYLRNGGKKHFINSDLLSDYKQPSNECLTTVPLNVYNNPKNVAIPAKKVGTLPPLYEVELLSADVYKFNGYDVAKIRADGKQYFCAKKYLKRKV